MSKENTKLMTITISVECWKELNILRFRKNKNTLTELTREILENYVNKNKEKENSTTI